MGEVGEGVFKIGRPRLPTKNRKVQLVLLEVGELAEVLRKYVSYRQILR